MKDKKILEERTFKIWGIVLCIVASFVIFHYVSEEVYFQRFSGIFVGFIEMYLNDYISLDYFLSIPLFSSGVHVDSSLSFAAQTIMNTESYFPFFTILFLILHYVTGLSPQDLVVLPLGLLFIPIAYFAMIKIYIPIKNKYDYVFHILLGTYIMLYLATTMMYGSFYVAPIAFLLIVTAFLCIKNFYEKENRLNYLIVCLFMLSLAHYWHSALMIVLGFIISLWIFSGFNYLFKTKNLFTRSTSLSVVSIVISLTFTHLWQSPYIGNFFGNANLLDFISKALIKLMGGNPFPVPYAFSYKDLFWGKIFFSSTLLIYILSMLILVLSLIPQIFVPKNRKGNGAKVPLTFGLAIIFAQIVNSFLYYKTASLNFFYAPFFFAIFGVHSLLNSDEKKFRKVVIFSLSIMVILSSLSNVALYVTYEAGKTSVTKYKDTRTSFEWLYQRMDRGKTVITDFNILGKYMQREAKISKPSIEYQDLNPNTYAVLVGDKEIPKDLAENYAIVDHATMSKGLPIHARARVLLEPKWDQIDTCQNQDKIYEDNYVSVFIFK